MPSRRILLVLTGLAAFVAVTGASGEPVNAFTATATPQSVKPSATATYTISLKNDAMSPMEADKAKIGIPAGFVISEPSVQASAGAAGSCAASTWIADGMLIAGGKINLKRPAGGGSTGRLCPGATLTVTFSATSPAAEGSYVWATELIRDTTAFLLNGAQPSVDVDGTAPTVSLGSHPSNPSNDASPSFQFSASEAATFECKLDAAAFAPCTSPKTYSAADGAHTFAVRATDAAGNSGQTSYAWTIDTVAPVPTIAQKPSNPSNDASPSFQFTATEAAGFQCKLDAGAFAACTSPKAYSPGDGPHTFTVKATDAAGNSGQAAFSWTIDTIAPSASITAKPADPSGVASAAFAFTASEQATFKCRLDNGAFGACTSPKSYSNLSDGLHTFTLTATDAAGNTSGEAGFSWRVETVLPVVTLVAQPTSLTNQSEASFSFTANKAPATFECRIDAGAFAPCSSPKAYTGLADGPHSFAVRASSVAGTGPETVDTWSIDTIAPGSAITATPGDPTNQRSAVFAFAASEEAVTFQCKLDAGAFASCVSPQTYSNLPDGRHSFAVRAIDSVSNVGTETAFGWTIENRAPVVTLTSEPTSLSNSSIATLGFSADEPATFQCRLDDRPLEPCGSPAAYGGLRDGGHAFLVQATDLAGNVGSSSYSWTVDATPPETRIDSRPAAKTSATIARFTFSGRGSSRFECRLDSAAFARCVSPRSYRRLAGGGHRFAVRAIDAAGNVDPTAAKATWKVTKVESSRTVAATALLAPSAGAHVTKPPLLRWRRQPRATYYNVQLYRSGHKVLSAWPTRTSLQLRSKWRFGGQQMELSPGRYQWYVWPGYGRPLSRRYGRLLGSSTFLLGHAVRR